MVYTIKMDNSSAFAYIHFYIFVILLIKALKRETKAGKNSERILMKDRASNFADSDSIVKLHLSRYQ